ncbi:hypothetical protein Vretifemale_1179, partial [Volvox reticuliferus]
ASLAEQETVAALRAQLLAGATAAAVGSPPPLRLSTAGMHLVAQLTMQLSAQADAAAAMTGTMAVAAPTPHAGPGSPPPAQHGTFAAAAPQLSAALRSLQWLVGALTRAAPAPIAASPHSVAAWAKASVRLRLQLGVMCTAWSAAAVAAAGHALLLCGQRHAAVALALEVMGREVDRVLDATKATLESLRANRSYDETVLADCMPAIATELTSHAATAVTSCFWLAAQMVLTPLVVQVHMAPPAAPPPPPDRNQVDPQHLPAGPPALIPPSGPQDPAAAGAPQSLSISNGSSSCNGSCYSSSLHVSSCISFTIVTTGSLRIGGPAPVPAAVAAQTIRPGEPSLAPLNQPLLTTWQPRRAVLYLDIARLNATAAAVAAAPGTDPQAASPPPAAMDTTALPHLPAALELLGWTLRHADEFYHPHFAAGPATEGDPALTAAGAAQPKAPSAAPSTASTPRASAIVQGGIGPSRRGSASMAGSVLPAEDAPPPPPPSGLLTALAADPLAALSEAKLAARMAEEADVAVLAGGRLADAGSMIKWLSQNGMLVLVATDLQQLPEAMAGVSGGPSGDDNGGAPARALARTLVGLLATHHLQAATVRTLTQPLAHGAVQPASAATPRLGTRSSASTPRTSFSGKPAPPMSPLSPASTAAAPTASAIATDTAAPLAAAVLQPLAVLTYLPDLALAKPALVVCNELARRVDLALQALEAAFAAAPPLAPHAAMLARHVSRQLAQQRLLLEGLLLAPELFRAKHPGTVPLPGSVAVAATAAAGSGSTLWQPWGRMGDIAAPLQLVGLASQASPSAPSRQSSLGRVRPSLPAMTPKGGSSRRTSMAGGTAATAVTPGIPPRPPAVHPAPPPPPPVPVATADAYSTESEDEEVGVRKLAPGPRAGTSVGLVGAVGYGGGALALLPDEPDADSDAASVASASTLGSLVSRGAIPR